MAPIPKPKRDRTKHFFREWREHRNLTQEKAITNLGWSQSKISRIESGLTPYNQDDVEAASEAYQCEPWQVIALDPSKTDNLAWELYLQLTQMDEPTLRYIQETVDFTKRRGAAE